MIQTTQHKTWIGLMATLLIILTMTHNIQGQEMGDVLIKNGTVITIEDGVKENTDVLIRDGKIEQIGEGISIRDIKTIDADGKYVMPGIIDAHSHLGLDAVNEATNPVTAEVWVGDALNPYDVGLYRALAGGVTTAHAMHGSANAIGGQCETIKHRWGEMNPERWRMKDAPRTIKFALGENPMRVHGERNNVAPRTRMGMEQEFRRSFAAAKEYKKEKLIASSNKNSQRPEYSLRLETLADILDGNVIIHCHSYRADEILMLMKVLEDYGVEDICFQHVNEGFKVAPELAEFGATASVFSDWWAYKFEVYYSTAYNATILTRNGVITSINSDSRELIRHLYHEAAKTQRYGDLTDNEALRLITINPAIQLGIEDRVGSIKIGKDGDIAIFENHPLSVYATPVYTIVDGVVRFNINEDPNDVRVDIDPKEKVPAFYESHIHDHELEGCMQGTELSTHSH